METVMLGRTLVRTRRTVGALVAVMGTLALGAAPASAATIGQAGHDNSTCAPNHQFVEPGNTYSVPSAGVITAMQYQAANGGTFHFDLNVLRPLGGDDYLVLGHTGLTSDPEDGLMHAIPVSIPVQAGDLLGIYTGDEPGWTCVRSVGAGDEVYYRPGLSSAPAPGDVVNLPSNAGPAMLNVAATFTPGPTDLCFGQPATITGNGVVVGTEGDDVIITGNGNDIVDGKGGNDRICTHGGDDHARGGAGNDRLNSGNGNDNTGGQSGNDIVQSTGGNDDVQGGDGQDHVQGGEGNDTLNGGNDVDAVEGQGGNDLVAGNAGSPDYCDGGDGTDATPANGGCETIVGIP
jgi:Ca2+-binding RTX toxin-like protein